MGDQGIDQLNPACPLEVPPAPAPLDGMLRYSHGEVGVAILFVSLVLWALLWVLGSAIWSLVAAIWPLVAG